MSSSERPTGILSPEEATAILELLVLRHLYDGDIVHHPLPPDHPDRALFDGLERKGWIARWNRIWPLRDRYRLTEAGIAEIERQYDPVRAEAVLDELRSLGLPAEARGPWLRRRGHDPVRFSALHDPYNHWETWRDDPGPNFLFVQAALGEADARAEAPPEPRARVEDLDDLAREAGNTWGQPFQDVS